MVPKQLIEEIKTWFKNKRYGNIQLNFVNGTIRSWNLHQSVIPEKDSTTTQAGTTSNTNNDPTRKTG